MAFTEYYVFHKMKFLTVISIYIIFTITACSQPAVAIQPATFIGMESPEIKVGAERMEMYLYLLKNKSVAVVANQTSMVGNVHLVDTLLSLGVAVKKVFSPEHGFRGNADAGEKIKNAMDKKTGLTIVSLYGGHFKPDTSELKEIDIVVFDIQDVGVRFYTYISTMH